MRERRVLRSIFNETYEEIFREFFSDILKEDLANLFIELLCWEVNQGFQSIKSTTTSFPIPCIVQKIATPSWIGLQTRLQTRLFRA